MIIVAVIVCLFVVVVFFNLIVHKKVDVRKLCITHPPIANQCEELALIQVINTIGGNQANLEYNTLLR